MPYLASGAFAVHRLYVQTRMCMRVEWGRVCGKGIGGGQHRYICQGSAQIWSDAVLGSGLYSLPVTHAQLLQHNGHSLLRALHAG